jgi:hypothetical protein
MTKYIFLIFIILVFGLLFLYNNLIPLNKIPENFQNYDLYSSMNIQSLGGSEQNYPFPQSDVLVEDIYPPTGRNGISNNGAAEIWWHYPIFQLGSYDQITNNIRYSNNPDEGTCMPASMCGVFYKDKQLKTNYVHPLPPINPECGTRVGYFDTNINLLPFRNDMQNILY